MRFRQISMTFDLSPNDAEGLSVPQLHGATIAARFVGSRERHI